jgi:hypothetical protein
MLAGDEGASNTDPYATKKKRATTTPGLHISAIPFPLMLLRTPEGQVPASPVVTCRRSPPSSYTPFSYPGIEQGILNS